MIFASVPVLQPPDQMKDTWPSWDGCGPELLVIDNTDDGAWADLCEERDWSYCAFGKNLGVPASWNVARATFMGEGGNDHDLLLLFSSSVLWHSGLALAMERMRHEAGWQGCQTIDLAFHAIAWSRRVFEMIGTFDENYWVGYDGDCDWAYRCILAGVLSDADPMPKIGMDAVCESGRAITRMGLISNTALTRKYYERKWGGEPSHETFVTPFDSGLPPSWWSPIYRPAMESVNLGESRYR